MKGDSADLQARLLSLIPRGWFSYVAPIRDAVLGGIADQLSWIYGFIFTLKLQTRISTATGYFLDLIGLDFFGLNLQRRPGQLDDAYRNRIQAELLRERVTRAGMSRAVEDLTGTAPIIFEPWNPNDTGAYGCPNLGYGSAGAWGSMQLPAQAFLTVFRGSPSGVPMVGGYGTPAGGYGVGILSYIGPENATEGVTDADIYQTITNTKPTGSAMWVAFSGAEPPQLDYSQPGNSQYFPALN